MLRLAPIHVTSQIIYDIDRALMRSRYWLSDTASGRVPNLTLMIDILHDLVYLNSRNLPTLSNCPSSESYGPHQVILRM